MTVHLYCVDKVKLDRLSVFTQVYSASPIFGVEYEMEEQVIYHNVLLCIEDRL